MADWVGTSPGYAQQLVLASSVQDYLWRQRQNRCWQKEAGGQLFGSVDEAQVVVATATGPYRGDETSRFSYRSHPAKAQAAIESQRAQGFRYLGEWHTHPEDIPKPSNEDLTSFRRLLERSQLSVSNLVLLVQGRAAGPAGVAALTLDERAVYRWAWRERDVASPSCARSTSRGVR